jgi:membrane protease YdiL (CAAX protease family)
VGAAENDDRPGETGPHDGPRAEDAPTGSGPADPDPLPAAPAEGPGAADPARPDATALAPHAAADDGPVGATSGDPGRGSSNGAHHGWADGSGNGNGSGNGAAAASHTAAALRAAPEWDPAAVPAGSVPAPPVDPGEWRSTTPAAPTAELTADPFAASAGQRVGEPPAAPPVPPAERRPGAPAPRTHRWGLGAYLLVEAIFLAVSFLIGALLAGDGPAGAGALVLGLAAPTVLAAVTALLITRLRGNGPVADLGLRASWRDVGLGVAFGVGGLVVTIPASVLFVAIVGEDASSAVGDVFGGVTSSLPWALAVLVVVVLIAPLCEEIVYRGLLWGGVEKLAGPRVAFGVSTLLFALAHFEFTRTPLLLVVALPIAAARYYTGRLAASVIAHQINNLLPGLVLFLGLLGLLPAV